MHTISAPASARQGRRGRDAGAAPVRRRPAPDGAAREDAGAPPEGWRPAPAGPAGVDAGAAPERRRPAPDGAARSAPPAMPAPGADPVKRLLRHFERTEEQSLQQLQLSLAALPSPLTERAAVPRCSASPSGASSSVSSGAWTLCCGFRSQRARTRCERCVTGPLQRARARLATCLPGRPGSTRRPNTATQPGRACRSSGTLSGQRS